MTGKNENVNYKPMFLLSAMFMGIVGSGFMSKEEMPVQNVPSIVQQKESMKLFVDAPVEIAAGEMTSIDMIAKTILSDQVPAMVTPVLKQQDGTTSVYEMGEFDVTLENFDLNKSSEQEIFVSVRKVESGATTKANNLVLTNVNEEGKKSEELKNDIVATYKLKVKVVDEVAPVVEVSKEEDTITEGDEFDAEAYFTSATDNIDGDVEHVTTSDVDANAAGAYTITYTAKDKAGNEGSASVSITVKEKEKPVVEEKVTKDSTSDATSIAGSNPVSANGSGVANAALGQVGQYQDCTALASRALAANGIYHRGYPASYMALGNIVSASEAKPGDLIYYANGGAGLAHIAVYIGNGQAVHGGWNGNQTVVYSAYVGSGPVFISIQ